MYVCICIYCTHTHTQDTHTHNIYIRVLLIHDDELAAHFSSPFISWHAHAPSPRPHEEMLYDVIKATHSQRSSI